MSAALNAFRRILGPSGVDTDPVKIEPYLVDERKLYRGRALAVLRPATTSELSSLVQYCYAENIPMVPQGGNTGYCGGTTPDDTGTSVVISLLQMNRRRAVSAESLALTVDAGMILHDAQCHARRVGLLFPLSMGSAASCQIGGNLSTNAGGLAVLRYGTARDLVLGLEVVLPNGEVLSQLSALRKDNTGYDLKQLFLGAEGTLGIISGAVLRLYPVPPARAFRRPL